MKYTVWKDFKAQIFTEMITYADENTMNTMAEMVATGDAETSALIFESIINQPAANTEMNPGYDPNIDGPAAGGMALVFLDNLNQIDSSAIGDLYEDNSRSSRRCYRKCLKFCHINMILQLFLV